jgi:hypothetical protein
METPTPALPNTGLTSAREPQLEALIMVATLLTADVHKPTKNPVAKPTQHIASSLS